jgi:glutathione S-transferase
MEELGLDYQIQYYKRLPTLSAPPALKAIHPLGKSPILADQDQVLAESAAILEYLQETYDDTHQFQPFSTGSKAQYRYWMHYAEGSLMPLLVMQLVMTTVPKHVPLLIRPVARSICDGVKKQFVQSRLKDHIEFLEHYLTQHDYFAGRFGFADIQMSFPLEAMQSRTGKSYPAIQAYLERISQRPAYFRALSREQALKS